MSKTLLFELGTEELPSAAVKSLSDALINGMIAELSRVGLGYGNFEAFATPRRLAFLIEDVAETQPEQRIIKRGPAIKQGHDTDGKPTQALLGFARSCGVDVEALAEKDGNWIFENVSPGKDTPTLVPELLRNVIEKLPIAKLMRWGAGNISFVRPVHWVLLLWNSDIIDCEILGVKTGNLTYGHRFHAPESISVKLPQEYKKLLQQARVISNFSERRQIIKQKVEALARAENFQAIIPDALLDEVTSIVEYPVPLIGNFDPAFLEVPKEALIASMQNHQKCFALQDIEGELVPYFITVSNIESSDPAVVVQGNQRVMQARLADAAFFFNQDRAHPLEYYSERTANVCYQAQLGSLQQKSLRMQIAISYLVPYLSLINKDAERAAFLSQCDLMTGMVGEFPELQGIMGYYYATLDGETPEVALALKEQYLPRFAGDNLPSSNLGIALSLTDRLDSLVGLFAIGKVPTGMKDPFKLRRHAIAVIRLLMTCPNLTSLQELLDNTIVTFMPNLVVPAEAKSKLIAFIRERLIFFYEQQSITQNIVAAVLACESDNLFEVNKRVNALCKFLQNPEVESIIALSKRVDNVLREPSQAPISENLFEKPIEHELYQKIQSFSHSDIEWSKLLQLNSPIVQFFDEVMVMAEDQKVRKNRLGLLTKIQSILKSTVDWSLIS